MTHYWCRRSPTVLQFLGYPPVSGTVVVNGKWGSQAQFPGSVLIQVCSHLLNFVSRWLPFPSFIPSARKWRTLCIFHGRRYFWGFHSMIHMTIGCAHRCLFRQSCDRTIVCSYTLVLPHDPSQVPSTPLAWNLSLSCFPLMGPSVPFVGKQYVDQTFLSGKYLDFIPYWYL